MRQLCEYLECGQIVSTHGVRGTVRLESRCDSPRVLASLKRMYRKKGGEYVELKVVSSSIQKNMVLCTFEGLDSLEAAAAMKGTVLYARREDFRLRRGEYFWADMMELPVIDDETGEVYGHLSNILTPGAHQVYVVKREAGEFMIPAVPEFIKEISLGEERAEGIYVKLIEGMIE
ncbi:MAG: 16S rRNA processing protein RimM [Clostridia bacterium]|nr:16S rRNA processing protein RimM [Clostridia bacterium]